MGIIIAKFRKKKTTEQVLEKLDKEIKTIEAYRRDTEQAQKIIVGRFLLISVAIYLGSAFLFYFYFFPASFSERLLYVIPLILAPVIIISTKKTLTWYYKRKISKNQIKFKELNDEKKKLLENVMENETYKVAKSILEKYAPEQIRKNSYPVPSMDLTPIKQNSSAVVPTTTGVRQRLLPPSIEPSRSSFGSFQTPVRPSMPMAPATMTRMSIVPVGSVPSGALPTGTLPGIQNMAIPGMPLPLPRAILPRERSVFDKMVEYLVGDGPSNRYALICKQCSSHNGMALKEEYEYLTFRCCYCYTLNPARKKRPAAPKLEYAAKSPVPAPNPFDTSESERNSHSETDSDLDSEKVKQIETLYSSPNRTASDIEANGKLSDGELDTPEIVPPLMNVDQTLGDNDVTKSDETESKNEELETKREELETRHEESPTKREDFETVREVLEWKREELEAKSDEFETKSDEIESKKDL